MQETTTIIENQLPLLISGLTAIQENLKAKKFEFTHYKKEENEWPRLAIAFGQAYYDSREFEEYRFVNKPIAELTQEDIYN